MGEHLSKAGKVSREYHTDSPAASRVSTPATMATTSANRTCKENKGSNSLSPRLQVYMKKGHRSMSTRAASLIRGCMQYEGAGKVYLSFAWHHQRLFSGTKYCQQETSNNCELKGDKDEVDENEQVDLNGKHSLELAIKTV